MSTTSLLQLNLNELFLTHFSYFRKMVHIFSSHPFYTENVHLPRDTDPISSRIRNNTKFWPYFKNALGALDGSHIHCAPPASERAFHRNRKGFVSQNCLFGCSFDLIFVYALTGWEGSAADARIYSVWKSSPGTSKRLRPDQDRTAKDRKIERPEKTRTAKDR